jgi:hypothetical protein
MNIININGKTIHTNGSSISINNNQLYIDGKLQDQGDVKVFNITVEGDVGSISGGFSDITVGGNVTVTLIMAQEMLSATMLVAQ